MDSTQELRFALREMDIQSEELALEYDHASGCLTLVRRDENYQDLEQTQGEVVAAFHSDGADNPLAIWLMEQVRRLRQEDHQVAHQTFPR